jgi:hypothetical protein
MVGDESAFYAAGSWVFPSTVGKPRLSIVDPLLLSALVFLMSGITFTPLALESKESGQPKNTKFISCSNTRQN